MTDNTPSPKQSLVTETDLETADAADAPAAGGGWVGDADGGGPEAGAAADALVRDADRAAGDGGVLGGIAAILGAIGVRALGARQAARTRERATSR